VRHLTLRLTDIFSCETGQGESSGYGRNIDRTPLAEVNCKANALVIRFGNALTPPEGIPELNPVFHGPA
jgi:hypothetical protein